MSELQDRLERLAGRGTPRGADEVLRAAQRSAPREIGVVKSDSVDGDLDIIDDIPFVSAEPALRRGRFSTLIAATGVAALVGVGMLAVTAMFGSGGADSPEAAVRQLADAVSHRDPLAAVDVLAPSEVRSMHESVQHISQRAADLRIVDQASQPLAGVDLSVEHLQLSSTDVGDGFAKVTVTSGTLSAGAHRAALSKLLQEALRNSKPDPQGKVDLARLAGSDLPTFVMTVRHDGRWYVSPVYTALEYAREANDGPAADFGSADPSKLGADSPEGAVQDAMHALQAGDWNRLIALAPPDELPVYDYRAWIDQAAADEHPDFTIDKLTTTPDVSGDRGVVMLEASGTWGSAGDHQSWQVGGSCSSAGAYLSFRFSDSAEPPSDSSRPDLCLAGRLGSAVPFGLLAETPTPETPANGAVPIRVVREGGRWFVSPVGTVLDAVDDFVQHVDEHTLYPVIGLGYLLPPDQTITLDQPAQIVDAARYGHVLAFNGRAGQRVVGEISPGATDRYSFIMGQIYTSDGREAGYVDFSPRRYGCCGSTATLPVTGSYQLVITQPIPTDRTLTLWDADHAPKALLDDRGSSSGQSCTYTANSVSCFGEADVPLSTSTTVVVPRTSEATATTAP